MKQNKILFTAILILTIFTVKAQENEFTRSSIKMGIGFGFNDGEEESGLGLIYSIGYQKSFGEKERFRINPNLQYGNFSSYGTTDSRDQYYSITSLQMHINYDLLKYKSTSLLVSTGGSLNYSSGLFGNGGEISTNNSSRYFNKIYFGGNAGIGLRINPSKSRFAYEIKPLNVEVGNKGFILGYMMFGMDIKLKK